jgi:hypothetical protein
MVALLAMNWQWTSTSNQQNNYYPRHVNCILHHLVPIRFDSMIHTIVSFVELNKKKIQISMGRNGFSVLARAKISPVTRSESCIKTPQKRKKLGFLFRMLIPIL